MRKSVRFATLILVVIGAATCASYGPPSDQDNVCAIFGQRSSWWEAAEASESKWRAPVAVQMAIIWRESSFRADAKPSRDYALGIIPWGRISSAYGFAQAIDGTWDWYREDSGNGGADRDDFDDATDFVGWYMAKTRAANGIGMTDAYNQYLAYHQGHAGYRSGRWKSISWLKNAATAVARQAKLYERQLSGCRGSLA